MRPRFTGLVAAVPTPMRRDGSLDLEAVPAVAEHCVRDAVSGLFVCGSTGEGLSLTTAERMAVAAAFSSALAGRVPFIVQVGHNALGESAKLAAHAAQIGAVAIAAAPPSYFALGSARDVIACCAEISQAAPALPFYYYHIPARTRVLVPGIELLREAERQLPQLAGIKFTFEDLADFLECRRYAGGRYNLLYGRDQMLLSALALGAEGAVGTTYSFAAPLYQRLWDAFDAGDLPQARHLQALANDMIRVLGARANGIACTKVIMELIGVPVGPPRLPLQPYSNDEAEQVRQELDRIGFFAWGRRP